MPVSMSVGKFFSAASTKDFCGAIGEVQKVPCVALVILARFLCVENVELVDVRIVPLECRLYEVVQLFEGAVGRHRKCSADSGPFFLCQG